MKKAALFWRLSPRCVGAAAWRYSVVKGWCAPLVGARTMYPVFTFLMICTSVFINKWMGERGSFSSRPALWKNLNFWIFPQIQTYIKSKLFWKQLDNWGFLPEKVWISFHKVQYSNYDKMRKTLLFSSVSINLFSFLTREVQNKIQTFLSENALNKGFTEKSLDFF